MPDTPITEIQQRILYYLTGYHASHGYPPSTREIADHFGYASISSVRHHLTGLAAAGRIVGEPGRHRALRIVTDTPTAGGVLGFMVVCRAWSDPEPPAPWSTWWDGEIHPDRATAEQELQDARDQTPHDWVLVEVREAAPVPNITPTTTQGATG